jgi:hypothetical protein
MTNQPHRQARSRGLALLRLQEPVRLYLYGVGSLVLVGLVLGGVITEDWRAFGVAMLAEVLAVVPATEAARVSVYAPATISRRLAVVSTSERIAQ